MDRTQAKTFVGLGAALLAVCLAPAAQAVRAQAITTSPMPHVRPIKVGPHDAALLLEEASQLSPTIRNMLDALEQSDVIVWVELRHQVPASNACLLLMGTSGGFRLLHIIVSATNSEEERMALLGHELWHALEIGNAPDVQDADSMASLYQRIGWPAGSGARHFETPGAIEAGRRVQREVDLAMDTLRRPERLRKP